MQQVTKCRFGFHNWSLWTIIAHYVGRNGSSCEKFHQSRTCSGCGLTDFKADTVW